MPVLVLLRTRQRPLRPTGCHCPLAIRRMEGALAATFAPLDRRLCRYALGGASSSLCFELRHQSGDGIKLRLGVTHRLRQHGAKLVFGGRPRLNVRLWGCGHGLNVRSGNLNLKAAGLPSSLHHEFVDMPLGLPRAYPQRRRLSPITETAVLIIQAMKLGL